jgi:hypothetical protein
MWLWHQVLTSSFKKGKKTKNKQVLTDWDKPELSRDHFQNGHFPPQMFHTCTNAVSATEGNNKQNALQD